MAKQSGLGDRFFWGGYDLSGDIGSLGNIGGGPSLLAVTGIDKLAFERIGGARDGRIELSTWFNPSTNQAHDVFGNLPTGSQYAMYCRGVGIGSPAANLYGKQVNYDPTRGDDGSMSAAVSTQGDGFGLEWGEQLTAGIRTDTTATNGTGFDGVAASTFGGQAYLQVFGVTGTSVTVTIQDSADNATFAAIAGGGTFVAAVPGRSAQRVAITGTVRRYVRAITTGTFTNAQFAVSFTRNATATAF